MKRSKFADEQILAIAKEGEAGRKVADEQPWCLRPSRSGTCSRALKGPVNGRFPEANPQTARRSRFAFGRAMGGEKVGTLYVKQYESVRLTNGLERRQVLDPVASVRLQVTQYETLRSGR